MNCITHSGYATTIKTRIAAVLSLAATFPMPTSKIRVSSQGPYSEWLIAEDTNPPPERGAWYAASWQPPKPDARKPTIGSGIASGAECTITWEKK